MYNRKVIPHKKEIPSPKKTAFVRLSFLLLSMIIIPARVFSIYSGVIDEILIIMWYTIREWRIIRSHPDGIWSLSINS